MDLKIDPIGQAIWDYKQGIRNQELLVHCSHTETDEIPIPYLFRPYKDMPAIEQKALDESKGKVLDIGAGAGCHAKHLQEKGLQVDAIEISPLACKAMQADGIQSVIQGNVYQLDLEQYDTILLLMNGIGLAGNLDTLPLLLHKLSGALKPGGQILLDSSDISYLYMDEDGSQWVDLNAKYYGELEYQFEYKSKKGNAFDWLFIDAKRLEEIAQKCALKFEMLLEGEHYDYLARLTKSIKA